jgi:hypothetical protein
VRINARLPKELHRKLKTILVSKGVTVQAWVTECAVLQLRPNSKITFVTIKK